MADTLGKTGDDDGGSVSANYLGRPRDRRIDLADRGASDERRHVAREERRGKAALDRAFSCDGAGVLGGVRLLLPGLLRSDGSRPKHVAAGDQHRQQSNRRSNM